MSNWHQGEGDVNHSPFREQWNQSIPKGTAEVLQEDEQYFLHQSLSTPCLDVIDQAQGSAFYTKDGKRVLDFHGNAVHQVGFQHPVVIQSMKDQLEQLSFSTRRYTNARAIELAKRLADIAPGTLNKTLIAPSASSAVSMALKLARIATGKYKTLSMWESFHGASMDAVSVGGEAHFRQQMGPLLPDAIHLPPIQNYRPNWEGADLDDRQLASYVEYILEQETDIGAFIIETIRNTDVQLPSQAFMQKIRKLCTEHNVKLIFDETVVALGRTGCWFAFEHYGVIPDMVIMGKGLGGAVYPMAALLADESLDTAGHTSIGHYTHEKSPLGSTAALAVLDIIEEEKLLERVPLLETHVRERLTEMMQRFPLIGDIRHKGLLFAVELVKDRSTKEKADEEAEAVMYSCLQKGLSFKLSKGNVIQLCPPLNISREDLEQGLSALEKALYESQQRKEITNEG
ncbi:(R)-1-hydroxy-2-aminoethylphosphonate ammonia-lyase [Salibacterium halotolerans]|uniref:4-aminobutyrate aminotransferase n=1 Tax=Salibacterium halotolerans TaxID=1884432 RepID=A0A1I5W0E2_9BACI|nr:aspartate aminotransferase family protein [Salibacterium halotolerans]SFQ13150.1 4-aminobutyrate aminotransferase [Salibacterium halotolerans]